VRSIAVVLGCLVVMALGCGQEGGRGGAKKRGTGTPLAGKKAVLIVAPKDFRDEELEAPLALLRAKGCSVAVACSSLDEAAGMLGAKVKPEVLLKDIAATDYDAIVFVGGVGASVYFDDPTAHALAKDAVAAGKMLAAICVAPSILARAGVLRDKEATAWDSQKDDLEKCGARWSDGPTARDGRIITGNGPKAAKRFAEALVEALAEPPKP